MKSPSKTIPHALAAMLLTGAMGAAQIPRLCNTGQTAKNFAGCTGALVSPNPLGGGPNRDGNWWVSYPHPISGAEARDPCSLKLISAYVDTPNAAWLPNSASTASEWITPYDGEDDRQAGYYVYATFFPISDSPSPIGFTINGQLASDNATVGIYLGTPAGVTSCPLVSGQSFPVNPASLESGDSQQWWPFSFTNPEPLAVASPAVLYFVVRNGHTPDGGSPTGLRVEFFPTSSFQY
ncbi:MAG: hypothetical protein ABSF54_18645 [Bryobacteraceae bacterium]